MSDSFSLTLESPSPGVGLITFADPARQNQLCWAAVDALADTLDECVSREYRVVVLASSLPGHWLEHAWLQDLVAMMAGESTTGEGTGWFRAIKHLSKPPLVTIAAISGNTCGGGCELGWACDLRVAERQALFAQPEIRIGITPGLGGISRLNTLAGRGLASEMVLRGDWVEAERLHRAGAINRLVEPGKALAAALSWAGELAEQPAEALAFCKQTLADCQELPLQPALESEQKVFQASAVNALTLMREQQAFYDSGGTTAASFSPASPGED
jgi:enoyl-CoA hydratase/carnithine racemase